MATAIQVAQDFADAVGFPRPSSLVGNANDDARQVLRLLNQTGKELASRHKWQRMNFEATFTTVATESQGDLGTIIGATQFLKAIVNDTLWNRTTRLKVYGPLAAQQWQAEKALTTTGPFPQFRIRGNALLMNPVPPAGQTCYFEYSSKCWCTDAGGTVPRLAIGADTDVFLVPDDLIAAGLEWRWLKKKGLEYAEEFQQYEYDIKNAIGDDKPRPVLQMDGDAMRYSAGIVVPIGSWNLP